MGAIFMAFVLCNQPGAICGLKPRVEEATIAGQRTSPSLSMLLLRPAIQGMTRLIFICANGLACLKNTSL